MVVHHEHAGRVWRRRDQWVSAQPDCVSERYDAPQNSSKPRVTPFRRLLPGYYRDPFHLDCAVSRTAREHG
jgi:hypothetical protein